MANAFANPTVRVNDVTISIVPNTANSVGGRGEVNVRAASAGGNAITTVHTSNAETKIGKMTFDVYVTVENERNIVEWQSNIGRNTVSMIENFSDGSTASETLVNASLMNDPEKQKTSDGVISLEFAGDPTTLG
jgi:hypothetical protein